MTFVCILDAASTPTMPILDPIYTGMGPHNVHTRTCTLGVVETALPTFAFDLHSNSAVFEVHLASQNQTQTILAASSDPHTIHIFDFAIVDYSRPSLPLLCRIAFGDVGKATGFPLAQILLKFDEKLCLPRYLLIGRPCNKYPMESPAHPTAFGAWPSDFSCVPLVVVEPPIVPALDLPFW
jgi:hypothetical protein